MILCLAYVVDDRLKAFLVVDRECASTLSPPFLANRRGRGIMCKEWTETFLLQRLEPAGAPGFGKRKRDTKRKRDRSEAEAGHEAEAGQKRKRDSRSGSGTGP